MNNWIAGIVDASRRHALFIVLLFTLITATCAWYAYRNLSVDTDTDHMFASSLPWRQHQQAFDKQFPQFNDLLVAVVRGATPEETDSAAAQLAQAAAADKTHFHDVSQPQADPFLRREGLLLIPPDQLGKLLDSLLAAQPLLGPLASDPSGRGMLHGILLMAEGVRIQHADLSAYAGALGQLQRVLNDAADGHPTPLSWQRLLGSDISASATPMQLVLLHPVLEDGVLQPGLAATQALERIRDALPDVRAGRVTISYTGSVALSDVQFGALTQGILASTLVSLALLALWLYLALRSVRVIVAILLTLISGLLLTLGFAAWAIGTLNVISVAFAVLFIGLAVDFAIQFAVRLRDERRNAPDLAIALKQTGRVSGLQIAVAAAATACGFLAFAPTAFRGVAELGIIAGVGMGLALICTLTLLPALLWLFKPRDQGQELALPFGKPCDAWLQKRHRGVLMVFGVLALLGAIAALRMPFDANPLHTQDPHSEPMQTLQSLADNPITNPFNIDILVDNLDQARALSARLEKLPEVSSVISAATFVPADQQASLDQLDQAQDLILPSLETTTTPPPIDAKALRESIADTRDAIAGAKSAMPANSPLHGIDAALARLAQAPDANLLMMNQAVSRFLPMQLSSLHDALSAQPITLQSLPPSIRRDWISSTGKFLIQVSPQANAQDTVGLHRFVQAVQAVAPDAGGPAVTTVASADTIMHAFQQAALLATIAIAIVLLVEMRRVRDAGIVLGTLLVSALLTALFARAVGMQINFANIIALPLLLGVGVSFNVYFVMNWRAGMHTFVSSASARAVLFSALTTGTAFGSLALSHDRGMASMGSMLLLSLAAVLIATFIFLPALLYSMRPSASAAQKRKTAH